MILCCSNAYNFAVSQFFEPKVLGNSFYFQRALSFNLRPKCFQITILLTFGIFGRARNHGKRFPKICQTSFNDIVHCSNPLDLLQVPLLRPFTRSDFKDPILGSENWTQVCRRSDFKVPFLLAPFMFKEECQMEIEHVLFPPDFQN